MGALHAHTIEARADTQFIRDYALRCLASHESQLQAYFLRERDQFRRLFGRSAMPKTRLAAETPLEELVSIAQDFWTAGA